MLCSYRFSGVGYGYEGNGVKHNWPLEVCFRCDASVGRRDPSMIYSNINDDAPWIPTEFVRLPWAVQPALAGLSGFRLSMIGLDIMHAFHLGVGRDIIGASVKILCRKKGFYDGRKIEIRLAQLMAECKMYAASTGTYLTFGKLKKSNLQWRNDKCPELRASAADTKIFMGFLSEKLQSVTLPEEYQGLTACVWSANLFVTTLSHAGFFLEDSEKDFLFVLGCAFLKAWAQLVHVGFMNCELLFKLRPKYHVLTHLVWDLSTKPSGRNPCVDSCWLEEDYVKWSLRKFRKLSRQTASHNILRRCLVQQNDRLKHWRASL